MYSAPSLVSNNSTAVSRSFVLKQFQANMPFVSQTNKFMANISKGEIPPQWRTYTSKAATLRLSAKLSMLDCLSLEFSSCGSENSVDLNPSVFVRATSEKSSTLKTQCSCWLSTSSEKLPKHIHNPQETRKYKWQSGKNSIGRDLSSEVSSGHMDGYILYNKKEATRLRRNIGQTCIVRQTPGFKEKPRTVTCGTVERAFA